jgi:hypothetical protein
MDHAQPARNHAYHEFCLFKPFSPGKQFFGLPLKRAPRLELLFPIHQCRDERIGLGWQLDEADLRTQNDIWDFCHRHRDGEYDTEPGAIISCHLGDQVSCLLDDSINPVCDFDRGSFFNRCWLDNFDPGSLFSGCLGDVPDSAYGMDVSLTDNVPGGHYPCPVYGILSTQPHVLDDQTLPRINL